MDEIRINIAARTDKAGRNANQDSLLVCADVGQILTPNPTAVNKDTWIPLGKRGALLVVADGMGGASSGEIASATVVQSLRKTFGDVPEEILGDEAAMLQFMHRSLVDADQEIKVYAAGHPESHGMGSTTVMVWLYAGKALCAWVGDSRIYRYGRDGLQRLSHDHSYVQQLVDTGAITPEQAFDHPNGNIITRAMGDTGKPVEPDVKAVALTPGDMLLLCSDGLCGLLRDDVIQSVIASRIGEGKPSELLQGLWAKGEATGWTDNATIIVAMTAGQAAQPADPSVTPAVSVVPIAPNTAVPVAPPQSPVTPIVAPMSQPPVEIREDLMENPVNQRRNGVGGARKPFLLPLWVWCLLGFLGALAVVLAVIYRSHPQEELIKKEQDKIEQRIPRPIPSDTEESHKERRSFRKDKQDKVENPRNLEEKIVNPKPKPNPVDEDKVEKVEKALENGADEPSNKKDESPTDKWQKKKPRKNNDD